MPSLAFPSAAIAIRMYLLLRDKTPIISWCSIPPPLKSVKDQKASPSLCSANKNPIMIYDPTVLSELYGLKNERFIFAGYFTSATVKLVHSVNSSGASLLFDSPYY
jgi:hypothetical protein